MFKLLCLFSSKYNKFLKVDLKDTYEDMQTTLEEDERKVIVDFQRQQLEEKKLLEELNEKRNYAIDSIRQSFK